MKMETTKLIFKLRKDCPPHLFISQIKDMIEKDKSLHKDMKNLLLYLKKTKQTHVPLSYTQEVVIDFDNYVNFQRGIEPQVSAWIKKEMDDEEKQDYNKNVENYFYSILDLYDKMGYELVNKENVSEEFLKDLYKITEQKKKGGKSFLKLKRK